MRFSRPLRPQSIPEGGAEYPPSVPGSQRITLPTMQDVQLYGEGQGLRRICGNCRYFNHAEGQRRLFEQKGLAEIVHDQGWRAEHLGADPKAMGVCGAGDGSTAVGPFSRSCDHFRKV